MKKVLPTLTLGVAVALSVESLLTLSICQTKPNSNFKRPLPASNFRSILKVSLNGKKKKSCPH